MSYTFDFYYIWQSFDQLMAGLMVTLQLTFAANAIGLSVGFIIALLISSRLFLVRAPFTQFIELFRCTPVLIQVVWFFYCVPMIFNLFIDQMTMGILALGLNLAAFNAEAYRAGMQSVPREQLDAGIALGLNRFQRTRYIIFPHTFRAALPVLMTNGITIFQQSALVAIVAIADLVYTGKQLATETFRPIETFTVVALIYFAISFSVSMLVQYVERRFEAAAR